MVFRFADITRLNGKGKLPVVKFFFNPNHDKSITETGYLADKAEPTTPDGERFLLGSVVKLF